MGALLSASLTIADVVPPRYLFAGSALAGAAGTAVIAAVVTSGPPAILLRFLTGVALAGVYPTGMKMMASWFDKGRGLAIGVLVGALTVGSASPHLLRAVSGIGRPDSVLYGTAGLAALGGILVLAYEDGPHQPETAPFDPSAIRRIVTDRGVGAWLAGSAADRWGRSVVTSLSMGVSGAACLLAGVVFGASPLVVAPFVLVWGFVIVADSAQFSAAVSELADESYAGSALTLQTAVGFLITIGSIQLIPIVQDAVGWRWAFAPLAVGPLVGIGAMLWLRTLPAADQLAGGRG